MKIAFICVVESNNTYTDKKKHKRLYETESLKCAELLKKYTQCDIFYICPTNNGVDENTKKIYSNLGVNYIEKNIYNDLNLEPKDGFYNKIYGCTFLESMLKNKYDVLIHIDLDMFLVRDFSNYLNDLELVDSCLIYDDIQAQDERKHNISKYIFNTCFIVDASKKLFENWAEIANTIKYSTYKNIVKDLEPHKLEELSFDILSSKYYIKPLKDLMFGETYTNLDIIKQRYNIHNFYFHHYHIGSNYNYKKEEDKFWTLL
ncbi:hypothetical phage protein [Campylobacter phage CP220]|uniref:Hypothetical phage protein n=1 Tax=Campylobacter phage CP220 TaxID=2994044 RepID=D5GV81_9CAUD|nr:hypothetical protein [Campylobacter jejuni]YP_009169223.1 hypothetical protein APL47_gp089 [Campylobacter phage CP220]RTH89491.1 hypothetical protein C3I33_08750 [Campylobacter jejuni]RTH92537.1 hypothetical protein C3I35_08125 [Campylobacter jejuni]RTI53915.1 hypothetical protein C3I22_08335 [Campylobacter jejuni]CBJ93898.1 hypothetical phage protein [Campylobacter phage CP220]